MSKNKIYFYKRIRIRAEDRKKNHIDKGGGPADASQITGSGKGLLPPPSPPPIDSCIEKTKIKK